MRRQLQRAAQTQARNRRALDAGAGGLQAARATDVSIDKARKRYTVGWLVEWLGPLGGWVSWWVVFGISRTAWPLASG